MKRREFLASSVAASSLIGSPWSSENPPGTPAQNERVKPEYYELRKYHMLPGAKQALLNDFLRDAAVPAWNRLRIGPIGVFDVVYGPNDPTRYVLLPHATLDSFATTSQRLVADAEYQKAGESFLAAPLSDPAYVRVESSLLVAFDEMPKLEVPGPAGGKQRIFELRIYESHGERAGKRKIEMFNAGGEIPIFRRSGLQPVFFGETLAGPTMPNLMYMLAFESLQARDQAWAAFSNDQDWKKLSANPIYRDTVSNITDIILRPASYSQI